MARFTQLEKNALIANLQAALEFAGTLPVQKSCLDCVHFENAQFCKLAQAAPPKEVVAVGCNLHVWDARTPPF